MYICIYIYIYVYISISVYNISSLLSFSSIIVLLYIIRCFSRQDVPVDRMRAAVERLADRPAPGDPGRPPREPTGTGGRNRQQNWGMECSHRKTIKTGEFLNALTWFKHQNWGFHHQDWRFQWYIYIYIWMIMVGFSPWHNQEKHRWKIPELKFDDFPSWWFPIDIGISSPRLIIRHINQPFHRICYWEYG